MLLKSDHLTQPVNQNGPSGQHALHIQTAMLVCVMMLIIQTLNLDLRRMIESPPITSVDIPILLNQVRNTSLDGISFVFLLTGAITLNQTYAFESVQLFHPLSKIFILGQSKPIFPLCRNCEQLNISKYTGRDPREEQFLESYIHSSTNGEAYERLCFQRFIWLKAACDDYGLSRYLFVDADYLVFENMFIYFNISAQLTFFTLLPDSSYFTLWSSSSLEMFIEFMINFYNRPRHAIFADYIKFGADSVRMSPIDGWPKNVSGKQWSDMYLFKAFTTSHADLRVYHRGQHSNLPPSSRAMWSMRNTLKWKCQFPNFTSYIDWRQEESNGVAGTYPYFEDQKMVAIHFQGELCKKFMAISFLKFRENQEGKNVPVSSTDSLNNVPVSSKGSPKNVSVSSTDSSKKASVFSTDSLKNVSVSSTDSPKNVSASSTDSPKNVSASSTGSLKNVSVSSTGSLKKVSFSSRDSPKNLPVSFTGSPKNVSVSSLSSLKNVPASSMDSLKNVSVSSTDSPKNVPVSPTGSPKNVSVSSTDSLKNVSVSSSISLLVSTKEEAP